MHSLYEKAKALYIMTVEAHIRSMKEDYTIHKATAELYESAFEDFHLIGEKMEQMDMPINPKKPLDFVKDLYMMQETYLTELKWVIHMNADPWLDNLLRSLYDQAQKRCATLCSLCECEEDEKEVKVETPTYKKIF